MKPNTKVLVVDDENDALEMFKDLFSRKGYEVFLAANGPDALSFIDKSEVDAVLLDIRMPGMDGIEVLSKMKLKKPELPIVMITAYGYDDNLINKALDLGATGYISKNLPLAQIVHTFETLLSTLPREK